jgi:divalent metal cation (Fe/Co/Zn/Cd) transporter
MSVRASDAGALRGGIAIEWWSIGWMLVEAAVSLGAGIAAGSVALVAFGADSLIELVSAGVLLRRLRVEQLGGCASEVQAAERRASGLVGALLFLLAAWVVGSVLRDLLMHARTESSPVGLAMAAASTLVMPWIVATKRRVGASIGSAALRADAACGVTCAYMAGTLLAGLALRAVFGWWWVDPLAALGIVYFVVREGREAVMAARGRVDSCGCH